MFWKAKSPSSQAEQVPEFLLELLTQDFGDRLLGDEVALDEELAEAFVGFRSVRWIVEQSLEVAAA